MRVFLAWHNTFHHPRRMIAATSGITLAVLLVFMQLGSLETLKRAGVLVYEAIDFDLIMVSDQYQYLTRSGGIRSVHLAQAGIVEGVAIVTPLNLDEVWWENPDTKIRSSLMILGVDPSRISFRDARLSAGLPALHRTTNLLLDELSHPAFGPAVKHRRALVAEREVTIADTFRMGMGLFSQGTAVVSLSTFGILSRSSSREVTFGLVRLDGKIDPGTAKTELRRVLPPEVVIFDRNEILDFEQNYYTSVMPLGIMARIGVFIAFLVGAVILYQVLTTDINQRLDQYATLKATGFTDRYIFETGVQQASLYAFFSFVPSWILGIVVFHMTHLATRLPIQMTPDLAIRVFLVTWIMCLTSGMLALLRIRKADPAELFR